VNANLPSLAEVWHSREHPKDVATRLFSARERIGEGQPLEATLSEMDAAGIGRGVLSSMREYSPYDDVVEFHELVAREVLASEGRLIAAGGVSPSEGVVTAARLARRLVEELDFRAIKVMPASEGAPPDDRMYYPLYWACCELGVPITINVGIPGPRLPADPQRPLYLDEVCRTFPELTVVMTHLGWPWHEEAIGLLLKYERLFLMTSAWAPKHYPAELVRYIATRGRGKVMFATDYPLLSFERCVTEARELPLPADAAEAFFAGTAEAVFRWS
jgi:predicted TIM-barrel fold metal-dependent hydrolase